MIESAPEPPGVKKPVSCNWLFLVPVQIGLIIAVGLGLYLHTVHAPFLLDDLPCIWGNPAIRDVAYLLDFEKIRALNIWEDIKNNMALRPAAYWTFAFNYRLGGLNEFGYHLVNIAIHLGNALLVYLLARATLQRAPLAWASPRSGALVPLLTALLFVAHPLQTQAVTYINQRFTSLVAFFYLTALLSYIAARSTQKPEAQWFYYGFALLSMILAMKTKESAITLPFTLVLYECLFLEGRLRQRVAWLAPFFLALLIIPGTLYWLVATDGIVDPRNRLDQSLNMVNFSGIQEWDYLVTQFGVIVTYLRMFLLPTGQNIIPYYPLAPTFLAPGIIGSLLLLLLLFGSALRVVLRSLRDGMRPATLLLAFGTLWFFITIAPSSSFIPLESMLLEYRVYLPSFGVFFAVSVATAMAVDRRLAAPRTFAAITLLAITLLSVATFKRNELYNDKELMLRDILAKNSEALPARLGLAHAFLESARFDEAIVELRQILQIIPNDANMNVNLGTALEATGREEEAIAQYRRGLALQPGNAYAHGNLGILYLKRGLLLQAERELQAALVADPHFGAARQNLAGLYENQGHNRAALEQYRLLLRSFPDDRYAAEKVRMLERGSPLND